MTQHTDEQPDYALAMLLMEIHGDVKVIKQQTTDMSEQLEDHEQRIRSSEKWRWGIPGAGLIALIGAFLSSAGKTHGL